MAERTYDASGLQALLPHRYPFLLVDRIDVIVPGQRVVGLKRLTTDEWWSMPPNRAAGIPFTLVLEALAQTCGALIPDLAAGMAGVVPYFMAADHVRFRRPAAIGDELRLDVSLARWRRGVCRTRGVATVDGALVVSGELTAVLRSGE